MKPKIIRDSFLIPRRLAPAAGLLFLALVSQGVSQTTYAWRNEAANGNWNDPNNWWRGFTETPSGAEILLFENGAQPNMTNNLSATNRYRILFESGSGSRVISGTTENTFFDFSGNIPKIENNSSNTTQTVNFPIKLGYAGGLELNPVNGNLTVGGAIDTNGNYLKVYGNNGHTLNINGVVSGSGGLEVNQNSVVLLGENNTYTGTTTVNAGTLRVNGNQSTATGNVTVASAATLGGNGTIGGATTINGTHSVGTGTGNADQQDFTNALSYGSTSIFAWDLTGNSNSSGFDRVDGDGGDALTVNSNAIFRIVLGTGVNLADGFWDSQLIQWTNVFTDFTGSASFNNALLEVVDHNGSTYDTSAQGSFSISGTTVSWSAVPEPSSAVAGLLVAAGILRRTRRATSPLLGPA